MNQEELDNETTDDEIINETNQLESAEEELDTHIKLDYTLQSPQERNDLVQKIIDNTPPEKLTKKYLEILADYIIFAMDKTERKEKRS